MWSTQVFILDEDGGEVISITTAGEKPNVRKGQIVTVSMLEALPWATNGRNGVAFRALEIKAAGGLSSRSRTRLTWVLTRHGCHLGCQFTSGA